MQVREKVSKLPGVELFDARHGFFKKWPYALLLTAGQLVSFVTWRPKMIFRRLCSIPSAFESGTLVRCSSQMASACR